MTVEVTEKPSYTAHDLITAATEYWDTDKIADQVWEERVRQVMKWGLQTRPDGTSHDRWYPAELAAKANYEVALAAGELTWVDILAEEVAETFAEQDVKKLKVELVQVMAVAASWLQDLELKG